jgi:hypothetical protein
VFDKEAETFFHRLDEFRTHGVDFDVIQRWTDHAESQFRRNRRQVVAGFPVAGLMIARYPRVPLHMEIAAIIDRGDPLTDALATLLGVRKNSVRFLCGKGPSLLGEIWMEYPGDLFRAVEMISPDRRPRSREDWIMARDFWEGCGLAKDNGYCYRPESYSAEALKQHMFTGLCARGYGTSTSLLARLWERDWFRLTDIGDYFRFAGQWCAAVANLNQHNGHVRKAAQGRVRDEFLMRYPAVELIRQSQSWHRLVGQNVMEDSAVVENVDQMTWPGLPGLPTNIGGYEVLSLTDFWEIQYEGYRMNHCVGNYLAPCMYGDSHIVSIRNDQGVPLSTLKLILQNEPNGQLVPVLIQHRGYSNGDPPSACVAVMKAILAILRQKEMIEPLIRLQRFHEDRAEDVSAMFWGRDESILDAKSVELMEQVLPDYDKAKCWLQRILEEEEIWYRYRNDQIGDELIKLGLDDEFTHDRMWDVIWDTGDDYWDDCRSPNPLVCSLSR